MTVGIAILTLNALGDLPRLLPMVMSETTPKRVVIFDSSSIDGTTEWVEAQSDVELECIRREDFNHGATREYARRFLGTDIVVFLTQDVLPEPGWLESLISPLLQGDAVVAYARQLPHHGADVFESLPREFNYPPMSQRRTLDDSAKLGVYTFFCSDSCSAYLNIALDRIGGFPAILTNEDYFAVAKLLQNGGAIAYVAEAWVYHSHRYTLKQEFERYFDTGYVRAEHGWVNLIVGHAEKRGSELATVLLRRLLLTSPWLIPYALLQLGAKWVGYRLGYFAYRGSRQWCRRFSSQKYYWNSSYCRHPRA